MNKKDLKNLPLKIERIRKPKFTEKKYPYKKYLSANWTWSEIFSEIDKKENSIKYISVKYNVNYNTLRHKYSAYKRNKIASLLTENRGGHNKKFNDVEEKNIYQYIKSNYIDSDKMLNNDMIKEIVIDKFNAESISDWWVSNFKKRWNLSTQKIKPSKVAVNLPSDNDILLFLKRCEELRKKVNFFFNYDETSYNVVNIPKTAIRPRGSDSVKIKYKENFRETFTLGLTISTNGKKLKPILVTKGKTDRCLNKFCLDNKIIGTYTDSGWVNDSIILILLDEIYKTTKGNTSVLLFDNHDSHKSERVKESAMSKNIILIYIPDGMTSVYQPLDVKINGIIKKKAVQKFTNFKINNPDNIYTRSMYY